MLDHLDAHAARRWALASLRRLADERSDIDHSNVYPVADGDTGTNLLLTLEAGVAAVDHSAEPADDALAAVASTFARGALLGARGSSGVILSQLLQGWADVLAQHPGGGPQAVTAALRRGADQAHAAVSRPVEGTMLTIARAAADGARGSTLAAVVTGAVASARAALARTPDQLDVLARAGVVDAGGRGLLVLLEALAATVTGPGPVRRSRRAAGTPPRRSGAPDGGEPHVGDLHVGDLHVGDRLVGDRLVGDRRDGGPAGGDRRRRNRRGRGAHSGGPAYEVMYLLDADDDDVPQLRSRLDVLGDSLVVVGGGGLWNVHLHTDQVGAAIEAGIITGRPHRLTVTRFDEAEAEPYVESDADPHADAQAASQASADAPAQAGARTQARRKVAVLATASGAGLATLLEAHGAQVVRPVGRTVSTLELLSAVRAADADSVVLLPDDPGALASAEAAAVAARQEGLQVTVLPIRAAVQALAAIAVHDPTGPRSVDLVQMAAAAAATRHGVVTNADATTPAGSWHTGQAIGLIGADVVEVGEDLAEVAAALALRMLAAGGELLTLVSGDADGSMALATDVSRRVRVARGDVEVSVVDGGQKTYPLLLGVE